MIAIKSTRQRGSEFFDLSDRQVSVGSALQSLCRYELAFGGQLLEANKTLIKTRTVVFNCIDETIFSGSEKEMKILLDAAYAHAILTQKNINSILANVVLNSNGSPLLMTASGPHPNELLSGIPLSRIAAAIAAVTVDNSDSSLVDKILITYTKDDDLYTFIDLWLSNKEEALDLLQSEVINETI